MPLMVQCAQNGMMIGDTDRGTLRSAVRQRWILEFGLDKCHGALTLCLGIGLGGLHGGHNAAMTACASAVPRFGSSVNRIGRAVSCYASVMTDALMSGTARRPSEHAHARLEKIRCAAFRSVHTGFHSRSPVRLSVERSLGQRASAFRLRRRVS